MKVTELRPEQIALRTLTERERQHVFAWIDHLKNWEHDDAVRKKSHRLDDSDNVFVLRTTSDMRIFFKLDGNKITVLDIATKSTIVNS